MRTEKFGSRRARAAVCSVTGRPGSPPGDLAPISQMAAPEQQRTPSMIQLTRLNGNPLIVSSELIKYVESSPDTVLTLVNGEKILVRETSGEVIERAIAYRARVFGEALGCLQALAWTQTPDGGSGAACACPTCGCAPDAQE